MSHAPVSMPSPSTLPHASVSPWLSPGISSLLSGGELEIPPLLAGTEFSPGFTAVSRTNPAGFAQAVLTGSDPRSLNKFSVGCRKKKKHKLAK